MEKPTLVEIIFGTIIAIMGILLIALFGLLISQQYLNLQKSKIDIRNNELQSEILKKELKIKE